MKRSEVLLKLTDFLVMESPTAITEEEASELAFKLLYEIEELGMLTPPYFNREYYDEPECDGMIPEWERE